MEDELKTTEQKTEEFKESIERFLNLEYKNNKLEVILLKSPKELFEASDIFMNAAKYWLAKICKGEYLIFIIKDIDKNKNKEDEDMMMGISIYKEKFVFDELVISMNKHANNRQKKNVIKYLKEKNIDYKYSGERDLNI